MKPWLVLLVLGLVLAGCVAVARSESPMQAPSPLPTPVRVYVPLVAGGGYTRHCWAMDTGQDWRTSVAMLGEGECGHLWWWGYGMPAAIWPACRSVAECEALDAAAIARTAPGATVLLLNEPNNADTAGGGWPVDAATAARRLRPVVERLHAAGLKAACCGLLVDATDSLHAAAWWAAYVAAGGASDVRHYHIFGNTAQDAARARGKAEKVMPGPWIVSEAGWCRRIREYVHGIDAPQYGMTAALWSSRGC